MKIDITKIAGYKDGMTAEEKLALLDNYEPDYSGYIRKETFDKTASELAEAKKALKAKMTEDEQKETTITKYKAKYLSLGYDEKLAEETAKALADSDMDKVFANQQSYIENVRKAAKAENIAGAAEPPAGGKSETDAFMAGFKNE